VTIAACATGEVLYVNDVAGTPCMAPNDAGACMDGGYLYPPSCCYDFPSSAYCVPVPAGCAAALDCTCANAGCPAICNATSGVVCAEAAAGVVDCDCGKL